MVYKNKVGCKRRTEDDVLGRQRQRGDEEVVELCSGNGCDGIAPRVPYKNAQTNDPRTEQDRQIMTPVLVAACQILLQVRAFCVTECY